MRHRRSRGYTVVELLVIIMVAAIAASLILPAALRARRNGRISACARNLDRLWKAAKEHESKTGAFPTETGPDFWRKVSSGAPALCPLGGGYRGPAGLVAPLPGTAVVGADFPGNHSGSRPSVGGNILLKTGEVQTVTDADALWEQAERQTR